MHNSGNRFLRFFLFLLLFSAIGFVLQACGGEKEDKKEDANTEEPTQRATETSGLSVGDAAPAFTLTSAEGNDVSLADYVGQQPVLLYFHMAVG